MPKTCNWAAVAAFLVALMAMPVSRGEPAAAAARSPLEARYLSPPALVTDGMTKAGEGYFAPDLRRICYQAVPPGRPFYEIFVQAFDPESPRPTVPVRVSAGRGRTTCSWFSPDGTRLLFAPSLRDPDVDATDAAAGSITAMCSTATTYVPADCAEAAPVGESSMLRHQAGSTPRCAAA